MGKATADLKGEHEAILYVLELLDKMLKAEPKNAERMSEYGDVVHFLKTFADKCHHGKEEKDLFVELAAVGIPNEGGPIGVMLREHNKGREHIAQMSDAAQAGDAAAYDAAARQYIALLRSHIAKENDILFKMADQVLDGEKQQQMAERFEQFEEEVIGHGVHEQLHSMIDAWAKKYDAE